MLLFKLAVAAFQHPLQIRQGIITDLNLLMFWRTVTHLDTQYSVLSTTISNWNSHPFGLVEAETTDDLKLKYRSYIRPHKWRHRPDTHSFVLPMNINQIQIIHYILICVFEWIISWIFRHFNWIYGKQCFAQMWPMTSGVWCTMSCHYSLVYYKGRVTISGYH